VVLLYSYLIKNTKSKQDNQVKLEYR